jgi:hypothetical protein
MSKIYFRYPFMVFHKCGCMNQVAVMDMDIEEKDKEVELRYELECPVCGTHIKKVITVDSKEIDLTNFLNVFKVIPALKDELAILKLDTVKAKVKDDVLKIYGNYAHLRFWDNRIERDIIPVKYTKE